MKKDFAKRPRNLQESVKPPKKLRQLLAAKNRRIRQLQGKINATKISDSDFKREIESRVCGTLLTFILMQLFHRGGNYTQEQREMCLSMHYTSPSLYRKLRDNFGFYLPSNNTISRWFGYIEIWPGICRKYFTELKRKVSWMDPSERNCVLLFDEMMIKKCFDFNESKQIIEGFQDYGELGRALKVGTHALVFMARGLFYNWKQPVAYFISGGTVASRDLTVILESVLVAVNNAGLNVRAIICDQSSANRSVVESRVSLQKPFFEHDGRKIYFFYDYLHIFKNLRNHLMRTDFLINNGLVSWKDISALWNIERDKGTRAAVKLSEKHVHPNTFERMNCRLALQVFSRRVSSALSTAKLQRAIQSDTAMNTASFVLLLNDLFDNLNSRTANDPNPQKRALSDKNPQIEENLLKQGADCAEWRTVKKNSVSRPPCFHGLELSIAATVQLWHDVREEGTAYLMTSRLQQDPIENLFSMLRNRGGSYEQNPSAKTFRENLQKNIVLNLNKPAQSSNCLDDEDETLLSPSTTVGVEPSTSTHGDNESACHTPIADFDNWEQAEDDEELACVIDDVLLQIPQTVCSLESCAIEYLAGYIATKSVEKTNCDICRVEMLDTSRTITRDEQMLILLRAYKTQDNSDFGHLAAPTVQFSMIFRIMNALFDAFYPSLRADESIMDKIFAYFVQGVDRHESTRGWFESATCIQHRVKLAYFMMRVKIHKDTIWLGAELRRPKSTFIKPVPKLRKLTGQ